MEFNIEKTISGLVESQFPTFYREDGPTFIAFVKAYYEWMEQKGNPIGEARSLLDYRDIDNTVEAFLEHFQKEYLYGIPFSVIINKRFLLKHVLDVYRSKGSIQCYKLLFKLLYNQDVEIYLPGQDILRPSDGTWIEPRTVEVTENDLLESFVGRQIVGVSSGVTAIVESYIREPVNSNIVHTLYLSNVFPRRGSFDVGEKIVIQGTPVSEYGLGPTILGSLDSLNILSGGQGFKVGTVLGIEHRDSNNDVISYGIGGKLLVTSTKYNEGALLFTIAKPGFGYMVNALSFIYPGAGDATGYGASFEVARLTNTQSITYNTDLLYNYKDLALNAASYNFPGNTSANGNTIFANYLTMRTDVFGSIAQLSQVTGTNYTQIPNCFAKTVIFSKPLANGSISYTTSSNVVTGTGTSFTKLFKANSVIGLQANSALVGTLEHGVVASVANDISLTLYAPPTYNSTAFAQYMFSADVIPANYPSNTYHQVDGSQAGNNASITGYPGVGSGSVNTAVAIDSGKAYIEGETVTAYLLYGLNPPTIIAGGTGYKNNEPLVFVGGGTSDVASGTITTNTTGGITSATLDYVGSNYATIPRVYVDTANGSGANIAVSIALYNTTAAVVATIHKIGIGKQPGYWSTTRGFLNSDKYIQDSYFYQDFSYQIKVATTLDKYKSILYSTFHPAGSEMFGQFNSTDNLADQSAMLYEPTTATLS